MSSMFQNRPAAARSPEMAEAPLPHDATVEVGGVYERGVIRLDQPLDLPPGAVVRVEVTFEAPAAVAAGTGARAARACDAPRPASFVSRRLGLLLRLPRHVGGADAATDRAARPADEARAPPRVRPRAERARRSVVDTHPTLAIALAALGVLFFAGTRFVGLSDFPIYFFTDEAVHPNWAAYLLEHGMRGPDGVLLPPFFKNDRIWNLSFSVYTHLVPVAIFGRSVVLTRAVPALLAVVAAIGLTFAGRRVFEHRSFWLTPFLMAALPAWFLHSRTGFETALTTSYYALFVVAYLLYRRGSPRWLLAALALGAAAAYSYANGQLLMLVTGVLLLIADARFHLEQLRRHPRVMLGAVALVVLLLLPYVRFRLLVPQATADHLHSLSSYLVADIPLEEKVRIFLRNYVDGLEPTYWFTSGHGRDIDRHQMKGMAHLLPWLAPFVAIGLLVSLRRIMRSPAHRLLVIAVAAVPVSAALVAPGITRLLAMMVPATLLAAVGVETVLSLVRRRWLQATIAAATALALMASGAAMAHEALRNGPTWYRDYGLGGMQWGASQVCAAIEEELDASPDAQIVLSPTWANNPNAFVDFFLDDEDAARVSMASISGYLIKRQPIDPRTLFVLPSDEYRAAVESGKLALEEPLRILLRPDGEPGFYFLRADYVADADARFEVDRQRRLELHESRVIHRGEPLELRHSKLDMNEMPVVFDGDPATLVRGLDANPFVVEVRFASPRVLEAVAVTTGSMDMALRVVVTPAAGGEPWVFDQELRGLGHDPRVEVPVEDTRSASQVRVEIRNIHDGEVSHVHLRELDWR